MNEIKTAIKLLIVCILVAAVIIAGETAYVHVDASEIAVVQSPGSGKLTWYTSPGLKPRWGGHVTFYRKREQFWFSTSSSPGQDRPQDNALPVRFNDGGTADISGSISYEMPSDELHLTAVHTKYGSQQAVDQQLIRTVIEKSIFMTGPLMSSSESYAARRPELLNLMYDQIEHGIYQTLAKDVVVKDELTGNEKTIRVVDIIKDAHGVFAREEESPLAEFGMHTFNLSFNNVHYDPVVEAQIQAQQRAVMAVQTAQAMAKTAEQDAITAEKQGQANAAKAKWEQEVLKAQEVTAAEKRLAVSALEAEASRTNATIAAEQKLSVAVLEANASKTNALIAADQRLQVANLDYQSALKKKETDIALGEGESSRRKMVMEADGALDQKLEAYVQVQQAWAANIPKYAGAWVPQVVTGGSGANSAYNGAQTMMDAMGIKAMSDLGLNMKMQALGMH